MLAIGKFGDVLLRIILTTAVKAKTSEVIISNFLDLIDKNSHSIYLFFILRINNLPAVIKFVSDFRQFNLQKREQVPVID
jgi:hypothetical protein